MSSTANERPRATCKFDDGGSRQGVSRGRRCKIEADRRRPRIVKTARGAGYVFAAAVERPGGPGAGEE